MNQYLKTIEKYLFIWKSTINCNSYKRPLYNTIDRKIQNQSKCFQLKINNKIVKSSNNFKYLILIMENRLFHSFLIYIDNIINRATTVTILLYITPPYNNTKWSR